MLKPVSIVSVKQLPVQPQPRPSAPIAVKSPTNSVLHGLFR
jgi:hypothetical protein